MNYCPGCGEYVGDFFDERNYPPITCRTPHFHPGIANQTNVYSQPTGEQVFTSVPIRILSQFWWDLGIEGQFAELTEWILVEFTQCSSCFAVKGERCKEWTDMYGQKTIPTSHHARHRRLEEFWAGSPYV